jgi:hypothetical protein
MLIPWLLRDPRTIAAAAALALSLAGAPARAQGPGPTNKAAAAHYNKGVELYGEGDKKAALLEFKRAYEIQPNFRHLANIAQIQLQVEDWPGAYWSFQRYLSDGGSKISAERRTQIETEIKKLHTHLAVLSVTTIDTDVEVSLDGTVVGKTPLEKPVVVPAGVHTLLAKKPGRADVERKANLVGEVTVALDPGASPPPGTPAPVAAEPAPEPAPQAPAKEAKEVRPKPARGGPLWIGWGVTGALGAGAVVTGVLAANAASKYDEKLKTFGVSHADLDSAQGKARTLVILTGALGAATVVSAGITLYLQLSRKREAPKEARFELLFGPGSVGAKGSF